MCTSILFVGLVACVHACAPHLLLVAVFEGGEVFQELHAETAPLLSLFVPASTTGGRRREEEGRAWSRRDSGKGGEERKDML